MVDKGIDFEKTDDYQESVEFLKELAVTHVKSRSKRIYGVHDTQIKRTQLTHKSDLAGALKEEERLLIEMLMIIPGITEEKAVGIQRKFKTLKDLMDLFGGLKDDESREAALSEIPYQNKDKMAKLGKPIAKKVVQALWSTDCNATLA